MGPTSILQTSRSTFLQWSVVRLDKREVCLRGYLFLAGHGAEQSDRPLRRSPRIYHFYINRQRRYSILSRTYLTAAAGIERWKRLDLVNAAAALYGTAVLTTSELQRRPEQSVARDGSQTCG